MRRIALVLSCLIALGGLSNASPIIEDLSIYETDKHRYLEGEEVAITIANDTNRTHTLDSDWVIKRDKTKKAVATYVFTNDEAELEPGEKVTWLWDQYTRCYGACQNVWEGEPVGPGQYRVVLDASGPLKTTFRIGEYFTLGFRCDDTDCVPTDPFVVFTHRPKAVAQMRAEAKAEEKTLIISGVVDHETRYNPSWSFKMAPGSIVLGEVFIEVCDQNPHQVEENREEWMGERWCPWSSYVEKVGR
jgi:hypothetical protein